MQRTLSIPDFDYLTLKSLSKVIKPPILYKYTDFDTGFYNILMKKTLKFSLPSDFNDPFDCSEKLINIDNSKINFKSISKDVKRLITESQFDDLLKQVQSPGGSDSILAQKKIKYRISCFTKNPQNILMWSHYGAKHSGMCIGFQFKISNNDFNLYPVIYQDEIFSIDGNVPMGKVFLYWLTVKAKGWEYEDEIRAISLSDKEIIKYDSDMIREIVFGCNVPAEKIQFIIPIIIDIFKPFPVIFKKLTAARDSFTFVQEIL